MTFLQSLVEVDWCLLDLDQFYAYVAAITMLFCELAHTSSESCADDY